MIAQMKSLFILLSACLLHRGVFGVVEIAVPVMEGDCVTLHTGDKTHQQIRLRWYFNDIRLALINRDVRKTCTDVQCDERFRDRLELDNQSGSLTISRIKHSDAGLYKLKILDSPSSEKIFNITVNDQKMAEPVKERESVTLHTGVANEDVLITWFFNDVLIAEISGRYNVCTDDECKERFRDRLKLDHQTGSLTITDTRTTDSGEYHLQISSSSNSSIVRIFNIVVFDSHVETPGLDLISFNIKVVFFGVILLALTVAVAVAVGFCDYNQAKQIKVQKVLSAGEVHDLEKNDMDLQSSQQLQYEKTEFISRFDKQMFDLVFKR